MPVAPALGTVARCSGAGLVLRRAYLSAGGGFEAEVGVAGRVPLWAAAVETWADACDEIAAEGHSSGRLRVLGPPSGLDATSSEASTDAPARAQDGGLSWTSRTVGGVTQLNAAALCLPLHEVLAAQDAPAGHEAHAVEASADMHHAAASRDQLDAGRLQASFHAETGTCMLSLERPQPRPAAASHTAVTTWLACGLTRADLSSLPLHLIASACSPADLAAARLPPAASASPAAAQQALAQAVSDGDYPAALEALHRWLDLSYGTAVVGSTGVWGVTTPLDVLTAAGTAPGLLGPWGHVRELLVSTVSGAAVGGAALGRSLMHLRPLYASMLEDAFGHRGAARDALLECQRLAQVVGDTAVVALASHALDRHGDSDKMGVDASAALYEAASRQGLWRTQLSAAVDACARAGDADAAPRSACPRDPLSMEPLVSYRPGGWGVGAAIPAPRALWHAGSCGVAPNAASGFGDARGLPPGSLPVAAAMHTSASTGRFATGLRGASLLGRRAAAASQGAGGGDSAAVAGFLSRHAHTLSSSPFVAVTSPTGTLFAAAGRRMRALADAKRQPGSATAGAGATHALPSEIAAAAGVSVPIAGSAALWSTPLPLSASEACDALRDGYRAVAAQWRRAGGRDGTEDPASGGRGARDWGAVFAAEACDMAAYAVERAAANS
jgi:hypothetical protein